MSNDKPSDIALQRLPQWAQKHIAHLEMKLHEAEKDLLELQTKPPSEVAIHNYSGIDHGQAEYIFLPKRSHIIFFLDELKGKSRIDRKCIEITRCGEPGEEYYLDVTGSSDFPIVRPKAANCLNLGVSDRWPW